MVILLPRAGYRRMRWKNDAGWTREIVASPSADSFDWRVSIAEIEADSSFSSFPGIDRSILVLDGAGMRLTLADASIDLLAGAEPFAFAGEQPVHAKLLDGPTRDFNVMTRRGVIDHELTRHSLRGHLELPRGPGLGWLVHVVDGHARIDGSDAEAGDSAMAEPHTDPRAALIVEGNAELLLVRLARATK